MLSYALSVVVNEIPQLAAAWLVAAMALAIAQGDLTGASGVVLVVVGLVILAGLVLIGAGGYRARNRVNTALSEGLPDHSNVDGSTQRPWSRTMRILLTPIPVRPRRIVRDANLAYGDDRKNRLDVYHCEPPAGAPVLVYFHGGGYFGGNKHHEARRLLYRFAARGWVCISADYRLRPAVAFPDHLIDAKRVVAWARSNAESYGGDAGTLVVAGSSAGGHLAVLSALTPNDPVFQPGFESADTSISAAVGHYGYYGRYYGRDANESPRSDPLAYDATHAPPIWLAHGDHDTYVDVGSARELSRHLRAASSEPVVYAELPNAQHGFDLFRSLRFEAVLDGLQSFLDRALAVDASVRRS
jgi:acetyl esterase/lipase